MSGNFNRANGPSICLRYLSRWLVKSRVARSSVVANDQPSRQVWGNSPSKDQATRASNVNKRIVKLIRRVILWHLSRSICHLTCKILVTILILIARVSPIISQVIATLYQIFLYQISEELYDDQMIMFRNLKERSLGAYARVFNTIPDSTRRTSKRRRGSITSRCLHSPRCATN